MAPLAAAVVLVRLVVPSRAGGAGELLMSTDAANIDTSNDVGGFLADSSGSTSITVTISGLVLVLKKSIL